MLINTISTLSFIWFVHYLIRQYWWQSIVIAINGFFIIGLARLLNPYDDVNYYESTDKETAHALKEMLKKFSKFNQRVQFKDTQGVKLCSS